MIRQESAVYERLPVQPHVDCKLDVGDLFVDTLPQPEALLVDSELEVTAVLAQILEEVEFVSLDPCAAVRAVRTVAKIVALGPTAFVLLASS